MTIAIVFERAECTAFVDRQSTVVFVQRSKERREILILRVVRSNSAMHWREALGNKMHAKRSNRTATARRSLDADSLTAAQAKIAATTMSPTKPNLLLPEVKMSFWPDRSMPGLSSIMNSEVQPD